MSEIKVSTITIYIYLFAIDISYVKTNFNNQFFKKMGIFHGLLQGIRY